MKRAFFGVFAAVNVFHKVAVVALLRAFIYGSYTSVGGLERIVQE